MTGLERAEDGREWSRKVVKRDVLEAIPDVVDKQVIKRLDDAFTERLPELGEKALNMALDNDIVPREFVKDPFGTVQRIGGSLGQFAQGKVFKHFAKAAKDMYEYMAEGRRVYPDQVDLINEMSCDPKISILNLEYRDFYTRAENMIGLLDQYANKPPSIGRKNILDMMQALSPTVITLDVDLKIVGFVIGSTVAEFGFNIPSIPTAMAVEPVDAILKELGVPE